MGTPVTLPIANGFYLSDSLPVSAQECVNYYPNIPQVAALSDGTLRGGHGIEQIATTGTLNQINRGAHVKAGIPYFVNGDSLYSLDRSVDAFGVETFTTTVLGAIEGEGRVSMSDNGTQLMILVPGGNGYIYDETDVGSEFQEITDAGFTANGAPEHVVFVDGFFAVTTKGKKWIVSALNDGLSWNALDVGTAEADPDDIVAPLVFRNQVYITGGQTTEPFQNIGGADFPFRRIQGALMQKGCFAPFSLINTSSSFMWVGGGVNEQPAIWQSTGGEPKKISTTAIDVAILDFTQEEIAESFSYSYAQSGQYFVGFSFPTRTFEYNLITGLWNERKSRYVDAKGITQTIRWSVNSLVTAYGRVLVGDFLDGRIGAVDDDIYTEYGDNIIRRFSTQPLAGLGDPVIISSLELTLESGVGTYEREGVIRMAISKDGKTFDDERSRGFGFLGEYSKRAIWRRLGRRPRFAVIRFTYSDPYKPVVIKLEARIKQKRA